MDLLKENSTKMVARKTGISKATLYRENCEKAIMTG